MARTGSCLRLREEPRAGRILGCLPDGERLLLAERDASDPHLPHPSIALVNQPMEPWAWVYVRTGNGTEGWVSHDYLDHD